MATAGDPARLLFERTDRFVCTLDLQGRFTSINPAGEVISGYAAAELIGRLATELLAPEDRASAAKRFAERLTGERSGDAEYLLLRRDGTRVPVSISSTLIEEDGKPIGVLGIVSDISEQNRASDALLESERRFRGSFESASIGMAIVSLDGQFLEINRAFCELVGYSAEEMTARSFQQITHADDLERDLTNVRRTLDGDFDSYQMEKRYLRSDGTEVWVMLSVTLVRAASGTPLYFVAHAQDIDARKRADERFAAAERRYRTLVEQLPLCMYIRSLDMTSPNIYVSPQVEAILGYPVSEWLNDPDLVERILHPDDRERVFSEAERVRRGAGSFAEEYRYIKPDGSVVWVQDEMHLVRDEQGEPLYVQGFVHDITERKVAEAERDRLRDELLHAQRLESLGRLAGGVAHDFNNMLTAIRGYAELLVGDPNASSSTRDNAARIVQAAEQAADLPRQLLAFGRKQILEPAIVNLNDVVSSIGGLLEHVISGAITVGVTARATTPWALADRSLLEHALVNLALNASDAMPAGGRLDVTTENVTIDEHDTTEPDAHPGSYVVIRVTDTGTGMDDETRRRAFEPFFTTKHEKEGSGLGLSSVYGTVAQSGGFVLLETDVGKGTTFSLHLPVADAPVEERTARTILLAEDEEIVRDLTAQILTNAGYDVLTANDGAEALVLYEEHRGEIDGVVTDIVMPGLGGHVLARQIREQDADLPIVFISGHHEESPETLQLGTGAALLQKPFSVAALVDTVGKLVGEEPAPVEPRREPTCVLADDHPAVLDSVSRFLESRGVRVSQARDGEEALATIRAIQPDVAIVDVAMSPMSGIDVARQVTDASPRTKVILYTGHNDRGLLDQALDAGARGFVLKEGTLDTLEDAVRAVAEGGTWVDPGLATAVASPAAVSSLPPLTPREREILSLVANGLTNEKVASTLAISPETVQSHVRHAMVKLEADTRTEAVATALRHSLIA